jgi:DNA-directed RNA polymerase III subunit RPC8
LIEKCFSDPAEQVWVWNYEGEKMFMDIDEPIRFRVLREQFTDATPTNHPSLPAGRRQSVADTSASTDLAANSTKIPPFSITVRSYSQQVRYYI